MTIQVNGPEKGVSARWGRVWETDKVNGDVAHDTFRVEYFSNRRANSLHVHIGQRLLREKATPIDVLLRSKFVKASHKLDFSTWFD
jgi:hypothetical protein